MPATAPERGAPKHSIIQSTTFRYETSEDMGKLFDLEASGYFYTRLQNPTSDAVAARLCALEGGTAAMLLSSRAGRLFLLHLQHRLRRRPCGSLFRDLRRHL